MKACFYFDTEFIFCLWTALLFFVSSLGIYWLLTSANMNHTNEGKTHLSATATIIWILKRTLRISHENKYHKLTIREHFGFSASTKPLWRWSTSDKVRPPIIFNTWQLTSKEIWQICPAWQKELGDDCSPPGNSHTGLNPPCNFLWHHFEHRMKSNILKQRALARHPARLMWLRLGVKSRKPAPNAIMHVYWA